MQTAPGQRRFLALWIVGAAALFALGLFAAAGIDEQREAPSIDGALWHGQQPGVSLLAYITREERYRTRRLTRSSNTFQESYDRFALVVRRMGDGAISASVPLADVFGGGDERAPRIIGVTGDILWIWRDSLEGRRLTDLGVQLTARSLTPQGAATTAALPGEPKGFAVAPNLEALVARGRDARFYRIDERAGTVAALDPSALPNNTFSQRIEDRFDFIVPSGRSRVITSPNSVMQQHFLTVRGDFYALLSESERATLSKWPSGESHPSGAVARGLYRGPYTLDDRQRPELAIDRVQPVGSARLIQAGFLVRQQGRVWDVLEPSSSLVMAKAQLGEREPWEIVRLGRDGAVLWRTPTELVEPHAVLDLDSHIALLGPVPDQQPARGRERLVWIDVATGARRSLDVASGEIR